MFESIIQDAPPTAGARIKVIGVGGGGGNAVNNMVEARLHSIDYIAANTDSQALGRSLAGTTLQLGNALTRGLGAGGNPDVGHRAALEDIDSLRDQLSGVDMVFITAGMGGGTGTGAAPVVAQAAKEAGALTVAVVTRPFTFEGKQRSRQADEGLRELAEAVDTLIVIPNDRILQVADRKTSFKDAFKLVDTVVVEAVRGISDMITTPGLINVDFADVVAIMKGRGMALMGTGRASGDDRASAAARMAISSPLLEDARVEGATGLLVTITGNSEMSLVEVSEAMSLIQDAAAADTNTIMGAVIDDSMGEEVKVTVVATGFDRVAQARARESVTTARYDVRNIPAPPPQRPVQAAHLSATQAGRATQPITQSVPVYVEAGQNAQMAAHRTAHVPPPPPPVAPMAAGGGLPHHEHELDEPAFIRKNTPAYGLPAQGGNKREPVVSNPFQGSGADIDRPAFMRK